jgi:hypothetical protein
MRAKRVREVLRAAYGDWHGITKSERRATLRAYKMAQAAKAGFTTAPEQRRRKPTKVVLVGVGKPKREWQFGEPSPKHPTHLIGQFFSELTEQGQAIALSSKFGPPRTRGSELSLSTWPRGRPGQGWAGKVPRPELLRRIEALKGFTGVKNYVG